MLQITTHDNRAAMTFEIENNPTGRKSTSQIGPAALAAALAVEAFLGLAAKDWAWLSVLSAAAFALTAVFGIVWLSHARARRRLNTALDAYAGQEIYRAQRWKESARTQRLLDEPSTRERRTWLTGKQR